MAGKSQGERVSALEEQVTALGELLEETLDELRERTSNPGRPAPSAPIDQTALIVALLDRLPQSAPNPQSSPTDVIALAIQLAKEFKPREEPNPVAEAAAILGPVVMDVLAKRNDGDSGADIAAAIAAHGQNGK